MRKVTEDPPVKPKEPAKKEPAPKKPRPPKQEEKGPEQLPEWEEALR